MIKTIAIWSLIAIPIILVGCSKNDNDKKPEPAKYKVGRLTQSMSIDGNWDKPQWKDVKPLSIKNYMGEKPEFQPIAQAKALYDDENIYVIFRVEDRYVRAIAQEFHGRVWQDSCVEFFFTPHEALSTGYFNLEVNCGGTALLRYQDRSKSIANLVDVEDMQKIEIAHSMPKVVEPEITEPTTWTLEYRLPLEMLEKYHQIDRPKSGSVWRANFYKCGDETSHPHWLTWSVIDLPEPKFHAPLFFGILEFE